MKKPTICRYCGGIIRLVPAADVYGSSTERLGMQNEYLYQCQNCNARVGCHKGTTRPLGDVANEILRLKRIEAHQVFDAYWQKQHISRTKAWHLLQRRVSDPAYRELLELGKKVPGVEPFNKRTLSVTTTK